MQRPRRHGLGQPVLRLHHRERIRAARERAEHCGLVTVDMHDPDLPSPEDTREGLAGRPEGMISIRQDDRLDSLIARLSREFAVVEQDEQRLDAVDLQPS